MCAARRPPDRPPQRSPAPRARPLARALLLAASVFVAVPAAVPADRQTEQRDADARQTLYVRRALSEDAGLAPHTAELWVEVRGTTAVLSGKLPSAMLKQRAVYLAGQVKGVADVRADELQVVAPGGVADVPSPFVEGVPPRGTLAGNTDGHATQEPKKADLPEPGPSAAPPAPVTLLAPIPVPAPAPSSGSVVEILPPRPLPEQTDLASAVEALRRKEQRFGGIKAEVRQRTVYLSGTVSRWGDATDLANSVRRLAGVEAVILDNIRVVPSGAR
jgi:osmotically-inducible protein OsmY